jgi:hypothetical protein
MALQLSASIYRIDANDLNTAQGVPATQGIIHSFPTQGIRMYPVKGTVTANGVTMSTIIDLLPQGLNQPDKRFYTPTAIATLVTNSNA